MCQSPTIYIIDDDPKVLQVLTTLVKHVFPNIKPCRSAQELLEVVDQAIPGCIVSDVAMPGMDGLTLHRVLIERKIELPIIFVTGYGNIQMAVSAMKLGAVSFLEKPVHEQQLWDAIRDALKVDDLNRKNRVRSEECLRKIEMLDATDTSILDYLCEGKKNREVGELLNLSVRTIEDRRAKIMKKTGIETFAELIRIYCAAKQQDVES